LATFLSLPHILTLQFGFPPPLWQPDTIWKSAAETLTENLKLLLRTLELERFSSTSLFSWFLFSVIMYTPHIILDDD
jgi:hypothetical protein